MRVKLKNIESGKVGFIVNLDAEPKLTQKTFSKFSKIHDSFGLAAQELCKHSWDDTGSERLTDDWKKWKELLKNLEIRKCFMSAKLGT